MDQLTIMRRANGDLFALARKGLPHLAVWPSVQSALDCKARNPELLVFVPALVASPFGRQSLATFRKQDLGLFLLAGAGSDSLRQGRKISWEELENL